MKTFLKWFFGIVFIIMAIGASATSFGASVIFLVTGVLTIPPTFREIERRTDLRVAPAAKYVMVILGFSLGVVVNMANQAGDVTNTKPTPSTTSNSSSSAEVDRDDETSSVVTRVGQVLSTSYFDVVINKVLISNEVNTGNPFSDIPGDGVSKFLVLNVTFKNTDTESRMISDGSVFIQYNGTEYEYDKTETILADGWGTFLDQINPLTSKTTRLVYRIPSDISGSAYYEPGRNYGSKRIYLGDINQ